MVTLFAMPKSFQGHIGLIQRNAIHSWTLLNPRPEIILYGEEDGTKSVAEEYGLKHFPAVALNEFGTPLVSDIFRKAQDMTSCETVCYVNADIILMNDFVETLRLLRHKNFLVVGRRWDIDITETIDFSDRDWQKHLRIRVQRDGKLHAHTGIDYFVFRKGLFQDIPSFAIGRTVWDNWLIFKARFEGVPVIDATESLMAVHQNHSYGVKGEAKAIWTGPEAARNLELAGGYDCVFSLKDATHCIRNHSIQRAGISRRRLSREVEIYPVLHPESPFVARVLRRMVAALRPAREKESGL